MLQENSAKWWRKRMEIGFGARALGASSFHVLGRGMEGAKQPSCSSVESRNLYR